MKIAPADWHVMLERQVAGKTDNPSWVAGETFSLNLLYKGSYTNRMNSEAPLIHEIETNDCSSCLASIICFVCYLLSQHHNIGRWSNFLSQPHVSVQL